MANDISLKIGVPFSPLTALFSARLRTRGGEATRVGFFRRYIVTTGSRALPGRRETAEIVYFVKSASTPHMRTNQTAANLTAGMGRAQGQTPVGGTTSAARVAVELHGHFVVLSKAQNSD